MATIVTGTAGTNGTNGTSPTAGTKGGKATFSQNGLIGADNLDIDAKGGKGGKGGNSTGPANGAKGGDGGDASITVNGNIFNNPVGPSLAIKGAATGGAGGNGGTSVGGLPGARGIGGNATVAFNGNIINPNKNLTTIELLATAIGGDGSKYGNASATLNGNIIQPLRADFVTIEASASAFGSDSFANHGNLNFGTKTATVNGNIVQGNIQNVTLAADAYPSNGTARLNGNIIQLSGNNTTSGTVALIVSGNVIEMTQNKVKLNKQTLSLFITQYNPYTNTVQNNEFTGTGTNTFTLDVTNVPGPFVNTAAINLANGTFVYNGKSNILTGFASVTVTGDVNSTLTGDNNDNILIGSDGDDIIDGGGGNDTIYGGKGNDILTGGSGNDELHGNDGDDTLDGGIGDDLLFGGAGDDTLLVSSGTDILDGMTDPLGDTASFINATTGGVIVDLNSPGPHDYSTAFNNVPTVTTLLNIQNVTGTNFGDTLTGDAQNNTLKGGAGNDSLRGNAGNDTLDGGADSDTAIYAGNFLDYTIAVGITGDGTVTDTRPGTPDGSDTLTSIQFIQFANGTYNTATGFFTPTGPANAAPVLDPSKTPVLATEAEDAGAPVGAVGTLVSSLVDFALPAGQVDNVTDTDPGALLGIALTGTDTANGNWFYSTDNGVTWNAVGMVSDASARLLAADAGTRLYFQPGANFNGSVPGAITFRAWDRSSGANGSVGDASVNGDATAFSGLNDTAGITINAVNDAPVANNDAFAVNEDNVLTVPATGVLANDTDVESNPLTSAIITGPAHGSLTLNPNGSFTYTPNANYFGADSFTYKANDGVADSTPATVNLTINAVNDAPVAGNDGFAVNEDNVLNIPATGVLANDTDVDGDPLTSAVVTGPAHGSLTLNPDGSFTYTPDANYNGADSFTYKANDGAADSNLATVNLTINVVNDAPSGADNTLSTGLNSGLVLTAADFGFTDPADLPANGLLAVRITTLPTHGVLSNHGDPVIAGQFINIMDINAGFLTFTPGLNESGTGYASFTFQVQDDGGTLNGGVDLDQSPNTITLNVDSGQEYFGTPGDDNHTGAPFDDIMHVSAGNDLLDGAAHINGDTLMFDTADAGVTATINSLTTGYTVGGLAGTTQSLNFENLTGSNFDDILTGDAGTNIIKGGAGNDILAATSGNDLLDGGANGAGGDTASFNLAGSGVTVNLGGATQNVGGGIGNITLTNIENLTGSGFGDILTGDGNANILNGAGGGDILVGNGGGDTFDGGAGIDTAQYDLALDVGAVSWSASDAAFKFNTPGGIDTLKNVEAIEDVGSGARILLVGGGGFATINDALAAANDGDTIAVAPGTYNESLLITKQVNIVGLGDPGDVVIQGTFRTDQAGGPIVGSIAQWLKTRTQAQGGYGGDTGITVNADDVSLTNLTVEDFKYAVGTQTNAQYLANFTNSVSNLTLTDVTLRGMITGFQKEDGTTLNGLTIHGGSMSDSLFGVYLANDVPGAAAATDTAIQGTGFNNILQKGIYAETAKGHTVVDGLTMDDVGNYGGVPTNGQDGLNGNAIQFNLKFDTYNPGEVIDITNNALTNVGKSGGTQYGAIVVEGRDDPGHPVYGANPADVSGLTVNISGGSIDDTKVGIRAGEAAKANPSLNVTGPALIIDGVVITNATQGDIDNHTQSLMTVLGTPGADSYISNQTPVSTGPIRMLGYAGNDVLTGGTGNDILQGGADDDMLDGGQGGIDTADYSDATSDGLVVSLFAGTSIGGDLGNDTLANIANVTGSGFNDTLLGDGNDNRLVGNLGSDIFYAHGGINQIYGDDAADPFAPGGTDVAYYSGRETGYSLFGTPGFTLLVSGGPEDVNDSLFNVERLKFLAPSQVSDVDNDGSSDLIFQNAATGNLEIRQQPAGTTAVAGIGGNNWRVVGTGQFDPDADRTADVLLQDNLTGDLKVVTDLTGAQTQINFDTQPGSGAWKAIATGDFNGDAASDVLLQNQSNGAVEIMFLNTNAGDAIGTVAGTGAVSTPGSNWKVISSGDFNGDGKSDILWQNSATKAVEVYLMNGTQLLNTPAMQGAAGLTAIGTGDFNGDDNSDILFKNAAGNAVTWFMYGDAHTGSKTITKPGASYSLSGAADVDANGYSDLIWNDPVSGATSATLLGGPASLVSTTVLNSNFALTTPGAGFNLLASTGGG